MVAARKRAQEDAALAGAAAREMAEAAAEVEAEERRERRRRRPHEEKWEAEEAVARRGVGEADLGWLAPGRAEGWVVNPVGGVTSPVLDNS